MSTIKEIFARNIEDDIAPVIYFHQLEPETAALEVGEYVFTTRPTTQVNQVGGIHEQMVDLLVAINEAITKGFKLPASWISGYFGSGKSLFAKLLGLALDGMMLPDGRSMVDALVARDDTANAAALRHAFDQLLAIVAPMAVIFDIGSTARNNEHVSHTVYRQVLQRLGYSSKDGVANFELGLETEGRYEEFLSQVEAQTGKPWSEFRDGYRAVQVFRTAYKALYPEEGDLLEVSTFSLNGLSVKELVSNLVTAMERRAAGKTIFVVVDEVSQYIVRDETKMLALQSFVAEVGGRAKPGRSPLWLLVTGQEKLEEEQRDSVLFKLQDRFPADLRVHLDRANVREVVGRRLLKKKPGSVLESYLTDAHIDALKLYGYDAASLTRDALIDHYPLLPAHIPLFMEITQSIRNTSTRTQSDAGGVRSVLNNIWSLFNDEPVQLKDRPLGTLLTLDMLYDIIGSSVNSDVQLTLHRIFEKYPPESYESRVAKAIALLEMNADQMPVTKELLAQLLYPALGALSPLEDITAALEQLAADNWIQYRDTHGYAIQNNAAQDWNRRKREITVSGQELDGKLQEFQERLVEGVAQPTYLNVRFPLSCWWGEDVRLTGKSDPTQVQMTFHWPTTAQARTDRDRWIEESRRKPLVLHWVAGDTNLVTSLVRDHLKSRKMAEMKQRSGQLPPTQQQLLYQEMAEAERLAGEVTRELRRTWMGGMIVFNGLVEDPDGTAFDTALKSTAETHLPQIFHKFGQGNVRITDSDFAHLLKNDTAGLPLVFLDGPDRLGIAWNDGGKVLFRAKGVVPQEIMERIASKPYFTGEQLVAHFGAPPYGYPRMVIKAAVVGLLREERVRLTGPNSTIITSVIDPGGHDIFLQERQFSSAEIEAKQDGEGIDGKDRNRIRRFFEEVVGVSNPDNTSDALADLTFQHFAGYKDHVAEVERAFARIGGESPAYLQTLSQLLTECISDRQVETVLRRVKQVLPEITESITRLAEARSALTATTISELRDFAQLLQYPVVQLREIGEDDTVAGEIQAIQDQLSGDQPWRAYADTKPAADAVRAHYHAVRERLLTAQDQEVETATDQLKIRPDFSALTEEEQFEVLQIARRAAVETTADAQQPSLMMIEQAPARIREAAVRAQARVDELRAHADSGERIHTVRLGLRNAIITTPAELDDALDRVRKKCVKELETGAKVRLED
ncbi:MAG: BREX system P-loop protein BrxC [Alkalispirochaeta sp.]